MPLTVPQQNHCETELVTYFTSQEADISPPFLQALLLVCVNHEIVFDSGLTVPAERLLAISAMKLENERLEEALNEWAGLYQLHEAEASIAHKEMHASQPKGILRRLLNQEEVGRVWGEDLDIEACLEGLITSPYKINKGGRYILPPVNLADDHALEDRINEILAKNIHDEIQLRIPLSYRGHWRLAKIHLTQNKIEHGLLWDSLEHLLHQESIFQAFKQQLNHAHQQHLRRLNEAQSQLEDDQIEAKAEGIQANNWSCADLVIREALKDTEKQHLNSGLLAIRDAKSPGALRKAVIKQIKLNKNITEFHWLQASLITTAIILSLLAIASGVGALAGVTILAAIGQLAAELLVFGGVIALLASSLYAGYSMQGNNKPQQVSNTLKANNTAIHKAYSAKDNSKSPSATYQHSVKSTAPASIGSSCTTFSPAVEPDQTNDPKTPNLALSAGK